MNAPFLGHPLVAELLADPATFKERGRAYQLLEQYFEGLGIDTLRPLLAHNDLLVRHAAVWVASELGQQGCALLDDVIALLDTEDRYLTYHALEVTVVCAMGSDVDRFVHIPRALESRDDIIQNLAMRLMAQADSTQLEAGSRLVTAIGANAGVHRRGLSLLAAGRACNPEDIRHMLLEDDALVRMYAAIAAKRLRQEHPELLQMAATLRDPLVSRFAAEDP